MHLTFDPPAGPAAGLFHLPAARLTVRGADAPAFLDRLCTRALRRMRVGEAGRVFFLDARGRTLVAAFAVRSASDRFDFECTDAAAADTLAALLDQYLFGEALVIERDPRGALGVHGPRAAEILAAAGLPCPEGAAEATLGVHPLHLVRRTRTADVGFDVWGEANALEVARAALTAAGGQLEPLATLDLARVAAGVPAWPSEYSPDATPLDVGLDGITDQKGCYPGQEVIERTIAIGRPARRLIRARLSGPAEAGAPLEADGAQIGRLTSVAGLPGGPWLALALIKTRFEGDTATAPDGVVAHLRPVAAP